MRLQSAREYWGESLKVWEQRTLGKSESFDEAKDFLVTVGLPVGPDWHFDFRAPTERAKVLEALLVIGYDGSVPLGVNQVGGIVALESGSEKRFVNSSLDSLLRCLTFYDTYRTEVQELDEDEAARLIQRTEELIRQADEPALQAESFWSVILEQMRDGLL